MDRAGGAVNGAGLRPREGRRRGARSGFTLIELAIVAAIIAVLGASLAAALHGGIRIWESIRAANDREISAAIAYEFWTRDVRNSIRNGTPTAAREDAMSISVLLAGDATHGLLRPGSVEYVFDRDRQQLRRTARVLAGGPSEPRSQEIMLSDVRDARFEFMLRRPDGSRTGWRAAWEKSGQLIAARLSIQMKAEGETAPMSRTAYCMAASSTNAP